MTIDAGEKARFDEDEATGDYIDRLEGLIRSLVSRDYSWHCPWCEMWISGRDGKHQIDCKAAQVMGWPKNEGDPHE